MSNQAIIERVSRTMVPVALDFATAVDSQTPEGKFLLPLMKQRQQNQGMWIFSPDGKALGGFESAVPLHRFEKETTDGRCRGMLGRTHREIDSALKAFGPVKPRTIKPVASNPWRGSGFRHDSSVCLAQYVRRREPSNISSPVISTAILSRDEFCEFAPEVAEDGHEWNLQNSVAKKLCRVLSPMSSESAPQPDWVQDVSLHARVQSVENGIVNLKYDGNMSSVHEGYRAGSVRSRQQIEFEGVGAYNLEAGQMQSLKIVGSGTICWPREAPDQPVTFDALIEWQDSDSVTE